MYGEVCHNYLEFTCEDYKKPGGSAYHTYPGIKFPEDRDLLQQGLVDGSLCTTATDDFTTNKAEKLYGTTIDTICGGHNGTETRLPVTYTKLVSTGRVSIERFAEITSTGDNIHQCGQVPGPLPQEGGDIRRKRRRYRPVRPQPEEEADSGRPALGLRLLHMGGFRVQRLPRDDHTAG